MASTAPFEGDDVGSTPARAANKKEKYMFYYITFGLIVGILLMVRKTMTDKKVTTNNIAWSILTIVI